MFIGQASVTPIRSGTPPRTSASENLAISVPIPIIAWLSCEQSSAPRSVKPKARLIGRRRDADLALEFLNTLRDG